MAERTRCLFCGKWTNYSESTCVSCSNDPLDSLPSPDCDGPRPWEDEEPIEE